MNVYGQICNNASQYSACSTNSNCGCLLYSFSDTTGVCGLLTQSCSSFVPCQSPNDACLQSGYVCVRHPQCSSSALCYPSTMFDQSSCPPIPGNCHIRMNPIIKCSIESSEMLREADNRYKISII